MLLVSSPLTTESDQWQLLVEGCMCMELSGQTGVYVCVHTVFGWEEKGIWAGSSRHHVLVLSRSLVRLCSK